MTDKFVINSNIPLCYQGQLLIDRKIAQDQIFKALNESLKLFKSAHAVISFLEKKDIKVIEARSPRDIQSNRYYSYTFFQYTNGNIELKPTYW